MFSPSVLDHFHNPRNCGPLNGATHVGTAGVPGEGPYLKLWFVVINGTIQRAAYRTYGCPAAVACGSLIAELAAGRTPQRLLALTQEDVIRLLDGLPEGKEHCAALVVEAVRNALDGHAGGAV